MRVTQLIGRKTLAVASRTRRHFGFALEGQAGLLRRGVIAAVLVAGVELLRPWPLKIVVDQVVQGEHPYGWLEGVEASTVLYGAAACLILIPLALGLCRRSSEIALAQVGRKVTTRVRSRVCEHLQLLPLAWHQRAETGDLLVRIMGDVSMVRDIMFAGWIGLLQRVLLFLATFAVLLYVEPRAAALALLPLPFLFFTVKSSGGRMKTAVSKQRRKEGGAAALATELLEQIRVVKAFGAERRSARLFGGLARSGEKAGVVATRIAAMASLQTELITGIGLALVLVVCTRSVLAGELSIGNLLVVLSYVRSLYKPLRKLSQDGVKLAKAAACAERVFSVLEQEPEPQADGEEAPRFHGRLRFDAVHFRYRPDSEALEGLDFEVPAGRLAVLKGANGSGKSTTIGMLLRLFAPDSGQISIDGRDVGDFEIESYRRHFAYVPQEDLLFSGTIAENLLFGRPEASREDVEAAFDLVARDTHVLDGLPDGLETEIGEKGKRLSGGQRRMVSLARAALRDASVLLLDEPLESLDAETRTEVARGIRRLAAGRTTIVVSHTAVDEIGPDLVIEIAGGRLTEARS